VLLSSGDSFPHLIQKRRSQLGFVTYLLNCPRTSLPFAVFRDGHPHHSVFVTNLAYHDVLPAESLIHPYKPTLPSSADIKSRDIGFWSLWNGTNHQDPIFGVAGVEGVLEYGHWVRICCLSHSGYSHRTAWIQIDTFMCHILWLF
jgi:hypothetical protein